MKDKKKKNITTKQKINRRIIKYSVFSLFLIIGISIAVLTLFVTGYAASISTNLKVSSVNKDTFNQTSYFYAGDDSFIGSRFTAENRQWLDFQNIPKNQINALVSIEDQKFFTHEGIDPFGLLRATLTNISSKSGAKEGASTITQQLARNVLIDPKDRSDKTYARKIKEALIAMKLEKIMSKNDIVSSYLNVVYFGNSTYGIQAAAKTYFNKDAKDLTLPEMALLAGVPQDPNTLNPVDSDKIAKANPNDPKKQNLAKTRRDEVLKAMYSKNYITKDEMDKAIATPVTFNYQVSNVNTDYGYYIDSSIAEAEQILKAKNLPSLYTGGYKIYLNLDINAQKTMESVFANDTNFALATDGERSEGAMVLYKQGTGQILAVQGGRSYTTQMGLNRAVDSKFQPGSTFKPIIDYGPAVELGLKPTDTYVDGPIHIKVGDKIYSPQNDEKKYLGTITARTALMYSINTVAVQILNDITPQKGFAFAKRLGFKLNPNDASYLSLAIGGASGVSPLELARAYGAFGNQGVELNTAFVRKIVGPNGEKIYDFTPVKEQVMSPTVAWTMVDMLKSVVKGGTGRKANMYIEQAGKTGTTESTLEEGSNKDIWYAGFTPSLTATIWMGFDQPSAKNGVHDIGGGYPARLWKTFMSKYLTAEQKSEKFIKPNPIENIPLQYSRKNVVSIPYK